MDGDALISEYIARLDAAAATLPTERRAELESEMREHIEGALAGAGSRDEVSIRNVLDRLGSPEEIVAAERSDSSADAVVSTPGRVDADAASGALPAASATQGLGAVEIIALLFLTLGSILIPFLGPILGLVFVWVSDRWSAAQKGIATLIVVALLALPFALIFGMSSGGGLNAPQTVPAETVGP